MSHTMRRLCAVCFTMFVVACATAGCEGEESQDATEGQARLSADAVFRSRWDHVGGSWTTGWVYNHSLQVCGHGANCNCDGFDNCGTWPSGSTVFYWPQGCGGPRWTLKCTSEPQ